MTHRQKLLLAALLPLALGACGEPEDTRPGRPVAQRQQAFKDIIKVFEPMGVQVRKNQYDPDKFLELARRLEQIKESPWAHFGPDTHYPPSHATAKVWSDPQGFETARQDFLRTVAALVPAAETRKLPEVKTAYEAVHDSCRNCHKDFKEK